MKLEIIALMIPLCLTACTTANFDKLAIPDVVEYSKDTQRKAEQELTFCEAPVLMEFIKDYKVMRDQARAAR